MDKCQVQAQGKPRQQEYHFFGQGSEGCQEPLHDPTAPLQSLQGPDVGPERKHDGPGVRQPGRNLQPTTLALLPWPGPGPADFFVHVCMQLYVARQHGAVCYSATMQKHDLRALYTGALETLAASSPGSAAKVSISKLMGI